MSDTEKERERERIKKECVNMIRTNHVNTSLVCKFCYVLSIFRKTKQKKKHTGQGVEQEEPFKGNCSN